MSDNKKAISVNDLILAVLHAVSMESVPVQMLIQIGHYMEVPGNSIRASLSSLVESDNIEAVHPDNYRIVASRSLFSHHINQWRLSEKRRTHWDKAWIICDLPEADPAQAAIRKKSLWALTVMGFQTAPQGFLVRPNNLLGGIDALQMKLKNFGLEPAAELFVANDYPGDMQELFETQLWPVAQLTENYHKLYARVVATHASLHEKITQAVLANALFTGFDAIYALYTDPLLPEEMHDPEPRIKLTRATLEFEMLGKRFWEKLVPGLRFT